MTNQEQDPLHGLFSEEEINGILDSTPQPASAPLGVTLLPENGTYRDSAGEGELFDQLEAEQAEKLKEFGATARALEVLSRSFTIYRQRGGEEKPDAAYLAGVVPSAGIDPDTQDLALDFVNRETGDRNFLTVASHNDGEYIPVQGFSDNDIFIVRELVREKQRMVEDGQFTHMLPWLTDLY